jgi:hypothetical protein
MTIIETAKLNGIDPQAYLAIIFDRIHDHKINRLDELLPWNWAQPVPRTVKLHKLRYQWCGYTRGASFNERECV